MDLFEYQGKQFFAAAGLPVPDGRVADSPDEAEAAARELGCPVAVKAQVRVGGRGKAGGIKLAATPEEAAEHAAAILGLDIKGHRVRRLWLERAREIATELYASVTLDRAGRGYTAMFSAKGGVDIEEVARTDPDAIARVAVDPLGGLPALDAERLVSSAKLEGVTGIALRSMLIDLTRAFVDGDAELVEVNPLVVTVDGEVLALDAKVSLDDNARFRHPEWDQWATAEWHDERERMARENGLNYVGLDGTVGVVGNGAGLVLATLDVVNEVGGEAANFLDVGGGASAEVMSSALEVVASDSKVRSILVNIFGGITRGEEVANGIVEALARVEIAYPVVVRLDGTNAEEGRAILAEHLSDLLRAEPTMLDAARSAVALAGAGAGE